MTENQVVSVNLKIKTAASSSRETTTMADFIYSYKRSLYSKRAFDIMKAAFEESVLPFFRSHNVRGYVCIARGSDGAIQLHAPTYRPELRPVTACVFSTLMKLRGRDMDARPEEIAADKRDIVIGGKTFSAPEVGLVACLLSSAPIKRIREAFGDEAVDAMVAHADNPLVSARRELLAAEFKAKVADSVRQLDALEAVYRRRMIAAYAATKPCEQKMIRNELVAKYNDLGVRLWSELDKLKAKLDEI